MITKLSQIVDAAIARGKKRLVAAYAQDLHTLQAVNEAAQKGLVEPTLVGSAKEIERACREAGIDFGQFKVVDCPSDTECVAIAVKMVRQGEADILMKGLVTTDRYMRGILNKEYGLLPPKGVLSHVTVTEMPAYHKLVTVADVAVIPYPDIAQKQAMARYLIQTANLLGIETPKVACLAPSEQMLPGVASSVDATLIAKMGERGQLGKALFDGPLALDVALFPDAVATKKLTGSPVAGDADCLLFPNIDAANVFFKASTRLAGGELAAMVAGTTAPCVLTSRCDSGLTKLYSIALACLAAK
jgi:phosphate butyryltransferase